MRQRQRPLRLSGPRRRQADWSELEPRPLGWSSASSSATPSTWRELTSVSLGVPLLHSLSPGSSGRLGSMHGAAQLLPAFHLLKIRLNAEPTLPQASLWYPQPHGPPWPLPCVEPATPCHGGEAYLALGWGGWSTEPYPTTQPSPATKMAFLSPPATTCLCFSALLEGWVKRGACLQ